MQESVDSCETLRGCISAIPVSYGESDSFLRHQLMIQAINMIFAVNLAHKFLISYNSLLIVFELYLTLLLHC